MPGVVAARIGQAAAKTRLRHRQLTHVRRGRCGCQRLCTRCSERPALTAGGALKRNGVNDASVLRAACQGGWGGGMKRTLMRMFWTWKILTLPTSSIAKPNCMNATGQSAASRGRSRSAHEDMHGAGTRWPRAGASRPNLSG